MSVPVAAMSVPVYRMVTLFTAWLRCIPHVYAVYRMLQLLRNMRQLLRNVRQLLRASAFTLYAWLCRSTPGYTASVIRKP